FFFSACVDRATGKRSGNLYSSADQRKPGGFVVISTEDDGENSQSRTGSSKRPERYRNTIQSYRLLQWFYSRFYHRRNFIITFYRRCRKYSPSNQSCYAKLFPNAKRSG